MGKQRLSVRTMNMLLTLKNALTHRYLAFGLRIYIGGLFIYASMSKITYTAEFAQAIASYQVIPYWAVNITAVVLPWLELVCGLLLVTGIRSRAASGMIAVLLMLFSSLIALSLIRGETIHCGCFHTIGEKMNTWTLVRDLIWMGIAIQVFLYDEAFHLGERFSVDIKEI